MSSRSLMDGASGPRRWPDLSDPALGPTLEALHLWSQVVGKVRLMRTPWLNHSWHVPLYVDVRGLTSGLIPAGDRTFTIVFDLVDSVLEIRSTEDGRRSFPLQPQSVASFYASTMQALNELGIATDIDCMPCELANATPFHADHAWRSYAPALANAYWRALIRVQHVFELFRTRFIGKCSPIHLFWGSFDLAVTRFSGAPAPAHPGGAPHMPDAVARDAYNQQVCSAGFWPGSAGTEGPAFYSYAYPVPSGFDAAKVSPSEARFAPPTGEFVLPYEAVRNSPTPETVLLQFLQSTYEAAADLGHWPRDKLERPQGSLGRPPAGT